MTLFCWLNTHGHLNTCYLSDQSHDSSVGIALGYELDDRGSRVRFPAGARNFSLHHRVQNGSGAHSDSYSMWVPGALSLGVKRTGRETDHSPPSRAQVKYAWSYISTPPIRLHEVVLSWARGQLYFFLSDLVRRCDAYSYYSYHDCTPIPPAQVVPKNQPEPEALCQHSQ
jgi:hypothetical protein